MGTRGSFLGDKASEA